jgi:hypothetical protein
MALSIPLPILLGLIVGGIGGTLVALHLIGWSTPARIDSADTARHRFALDYPDVPVLDVQIAADGASALLLLEDDHLALITVLGDRFVVRKLGRGSVRGLRIDPDHIELQLDDPGFPRATIQLPESDDRTPWVRRLSTCVSTALAS